MSKWYYESIGKLHGPFSLDELRYLARRGQISGRDRVRKGDSGDWVPAKRVSGLLANNRSERSNVATGSSVTSHPLDSVAQFRASMANNPPADSIPVESESTATTVDLSEADPGSVVPTPPAPPPKFQAPPSSADHRKRWLIGSSVAAALLLLIACLFLLFNLSEGGGGAGSSSQAGTGAAGTGAAGNGSQEGQGGQPSASGTENTASIGGSSSESEGGSGNADGTESTAENGSDPELTGDPEVVVTSTSAQAALNNVVQKNSYRSAFTIGGSEFFGVTATGTRFVYIIDSSLSMDMMGSQRFNKARDELLRSLFSLEDDCEFLVIFFCSDAFPMFGSTDLLQATPANKAKAEKWVTRFRTGPYTDPESAIKMALEQRPDGIFLLSDGEFEARSVSTARRMNSHNVTINTIGFEDRAGEANLKQIATDSGGKYYFVP